MNKNLRTAAAMITALAAGAVNALAADSGEIDIYLYEDINNNGYFDYGIDNPYTGFEFTVTSKTDPSRVFTAAVNKWGAAQIEIPAPDEDSDEGWFEKFDVSTPVLPKGAIWETGGLMETADFITETWSNDGDCYEIFYPYCYAAEVWAFVFEDTDADGKYSPEIDVPLRGTEVYARGSSMFGYESVVESNGYAKLDRGKPGTYSLVIETPKDSYVYTCTTGNSESTSITAENLTRIEKSDGTDQFVFIMSPIGYVKSEPTPTPEPTATPTPKPTATPTPEPTSTLTAEPTATPTVEPTATPTPTPTSKPMATPTPEPTATPTPEPTATPTPEPTATPTPEPTATPIPKPTATPTPEPTATSTPEATATPTAEPTATPTPEPTPVPTEKPKVMLDSGTVHLNIKEDTVTVIFANYENGRLTGIKSETVSGISSVQCDGMRSSGKILIWKSFDDMEPIALFEV